MYFLLLVFCDVKKHATVQNTPVNRALTHLSVCQTSIQQYDEKLEQKFTATINFILKGLLFHSVFYT